MFIETFSGWTEEFPDKHETTSMVKRKILEDILARYRFSQMIGSDNGQPFVSQGSWGLVSILGNDWNLYCTYGLQTGRKDNQDPKINLTKLT